VDDRSRHTYEFMENETAFDLTSAIRQWRAHLAQWPNFESAALDELESHLWDCIRDLEGRGLSQEEAFTIAARRIGPAPVVAAEFAKINGHGVWIDRMLWFVIAWLCVSAFESFRSVLASGILFLLPFGTHVFVRLVPLIGAAVVLASLIRRNGFGARVLVNLSRRPFMLAGSFFLVQLVPEVLRYMGQLGLLRGTAFYEDWGLLAPFHGSAEIVGLALDAPVPQLFTSNLLSLTIWIIGPLLILILATRRLRLARQ